MTQVEFHYNASDALRLAARLAAHFIESKRKIVIYAPDHAKYEGIDRMLWTYAQISFLPHCPADADIAPETPIWLTRDMEDVLDADDVLFNLSEEVPNAFSRFTTVVEVIGVLEEERAPGRKRYKFYQDRGYPIDRLDHQEP